MRFDDPRLVFKALCVLDEAIEMAHAGAVPPSFGLRFALCFLYLAGDRQQEYFDREPYDAFWRLATKSTAAFGQAGDSTAGAVRQTALHTAFNGISRAAGMPSTPDLDAAIGKVRADARRRASDGR